MFAFTAAHYQLSPLDTSPLNLTWNSFRSQIPTTEPRWTETRCVQLVHEEIPTILHDNCLRLVTTLVASREADVSVQCFVFHRRVPVSQPARCPGIAISIHRTTVLHFLARGAGESVPGVRQVTIAQQVFARFLVGQYLPVAGQQQGIVRACVELDLCGGKKMRCQMARSDVWLTKIMWKEGCWSVSWVYKELKHQHGRRRRQRW